MAESLGANYWKKVAGRLGPEPGEAYRDRLICPDDDAPLERDEGGRQFRCSACNRVFSYDKGWIEALPGSDAYMLGEVDRGRLAKHVAEADGQIQSPENRFGVLWSTMFEVVGDLKGKRVLDVCCGSGWASARLAERGGLVAGVDIVDGPGGLEDASKMRESRGLSFDLFQADVVRLPFAPETFDVVFLCRALSELRRPERMVLEMRRVLHPEGVVVNLGEPLHQDTMGIGIGGYDPRREGGGLSLEDYEAIYREGDFAFESYTAEGRDQNGGGFLSRLFKGKSDTRPRLFVARPKEFGVKWKPSLSLPWKKRANDERTDHQSG